jgi:erythromycin esterase
VRKTLLALALWLSALPAGAEPRPFLDLDFEAGECIGGWRVPTTDRGPFEAGMDRAQHRSGKQSGKIRYAGEGVWTESLGSGGLAQAFPAADAAGKRVRFSADVRTEGVTVGSAGLFWTAFDESFKTVAAANTTPQGPKGTTPWTRHTLEVDVPAETRTVFFGVRLAGNGTAWFDAVAIEVDGVRWEEGPQHIPKPDPRAVSWLRREAIPFATERPGSGFADLQRLKPLIGDARVVALGEASHGTRELFQMKHRLVEFLATEMGFTHFAIEDSMPEAYRINEYVLTGEGDPRKLLNELYWVWDTQEVLDMILWMREFNRSGKGRIQFLGFDMQRSKAAAPTVVGFLRKADPEYAGDAEAAFARVGPAKESRKATAADAAVAQSVLDHMTGRRADYLARFPREEVDWAIQSARVYLQDLQHISRTGSRERIMADNIGWIAEQAPPGSKVILWAHNFHVRKDPEGWMGSYLAERFGRDLFVFGFAFGEGRYNTQGPKGIMIAPEAPPPLPGSAESYLRAAGLPRFFLDLRRVPDSGPAAYLRQPLELRNVGAAEVPCPFRPHQVTKEYDALIWFEHTTPSVLLPRGKAEPKAGEGAASEGARKD